MTGFDRKSRPSKNRSLAIAGASMAVMAHSSDALAAIIYSGEVNQVVEGNETFVLNLDSKGSEEFQFDTINEGKGGTRESNILSLKVDNGGKGKAAPEAEWVSIGGNVARLSQGDLIDGSANFDVSEVMTPLVGAPGGQWTVGSTGFIGVRFDGKGSPDNFGWIEITANKQSRIVINSWAYEDSGAAINAGATGIVPEPCSLLLAGITATSALVAKRFLAKPNSNEQAISE